MESDVDNIDVSTFKGGDYDSSFETDIEKRAGNKDDLTRKPKRSHVLPSKSEFRSAAPHSMKNYSFFQSLNAYERHKKLINDYFLYYPGSTSLLKRDCSRDKRDLDIIRENHKFLWEEGEEVDSWEKQLAKKYYDKLYKEYCITDLSRYKENMIAMRWRIEKEVVTGKGQFSCGNKHCNRDDGLRTWEVNFAYNECDERKNALVKLRLCEACSTKLNHHHKRREVIKPVKSPKKTKVQSNAKKPKLDHADSESQDHVSNTVEASNIWKNQSSEAAEIKSRDEEFEEYLNDLFM